MSLLQKLVATLSTIFLLSSNSFANSNTKIANQSQPTTIKSDFINVKRKSQTIDFIGNVIVEKGEDSMLSNSMTVFYEEKSTDKNPSSNLSAKAEIKTISAKNNVKIFSKEFVASAKRGNYDPNKNIFILEEKVVVNKGSSVATGEKFIYDLTSKKGKFIGKDNNSKNTNTRSVIIINNEELKQ